MEKFPRDQGGVTWLIPKKQEEWKGLFPTLKRSHSKGWPKTENFLVFWQGQDEPKICFG